MPRVTMSACNLVIRPPRERPSALPRMETVNQWPERSGRARQAQPCRVMNSQLLNAWRVVRPYRCRAASAARAAPTAHQSSPCRMLTRPPSRIPTPDQSRLRVNTPWFRPHLMLRLDTHVGNKCRASRAHFQSCRLHISYRPLVSSPFSVEPDPMYVACPAHGLVSSARAKANKVCHYSEPASAPARIRSLTLPCGRYAVRR